MDWNTLRNKTEKSFQKETFRKLKDFGMIIPAAEKNEQ